MKGIIILANDFEDVEAIATINVLRRAGLEITMASLAESLDLKTQSGIAIKAEKMLKDLKLSDYDFLVIPGGKAVSKHLQKSKDTEETIKHFASRGKLVASICAAPSLVGKLGFFKGEKFTCFPSFETGIDGVFTGGEVETQGEFITARAMYYSQDFALAIIEKLLGKEKAKMVDKSIKGKE